MALILPFWLLSAIVTHYSIFSTNAENVFVRPSEFEDVTCPYQPCLTLNDYARETDQYIVDNTTFLFLPGIHQLDIQLYLENVSNTAFLVFDELQDDTAQVFLSPLVSITWTDCDNIELGAWSLLSVDTREKHSSFSGLVLQRTSSYRFLSQLTLFRNSKLKSTAIFLSDSNQVKISKYNDFGSNNYQWSCSLCTLRTVL